MDTTERMMIMGMCLQGLLANPSRTPLHRGDASAADFQAQIDKHIAANVLLAHRYADRLDPPPEATDAQRIMKISRVAYEVVRASGLYSAHWLDWDAARTSTVKNDMDRVEDVVERVGRWFKDPAGLADTGHDQLIRAITLACVGGL